jgi:hypothetical protein
VRFSGVEGKAVGTESVLRSDGSRFEPSTKDGAMRLVDAIFAGVGS